MAPWPKDKVPPHLIPYLIPAGHGRGLYGVVLYRGKAISMTAAILAVNAIEHRRERFSAAIKRRI